MYNIRNIYLDNVGYKDAWFRDLNIPLYEYHTGKISNSVLSLTNGGGKTTILSLIFSCIVPEQRNFIQHLQKSAHNFRDYFDKTPGVIVLELEKQAQKETNLFDEKFVIGQYVYINQSDQEPFRLFFSFNPDSFNINEIPTFSGGEIKSRSDLKTWITKAQTKYSNFFFTSKQLEWKEWLDGNGVDTWLAEKQVGFCRSEGGIDRFMSFNSERDFLKEFFYMSLSTEDSEDVRSVLSLSLKKLKKRPRFEAQSDILKKLQEIQYLLSKDTSDYLKSHKNHESVKNELESIYKAFKTDIQVKEDEITKKENSFLKLKEELKKAETDQKRNILNLKCLNYLSVKKNIEEKTDLLSDLERNKELLLIEEQNCKSALIYKRIKILESEIDGLKGNVKSDKTIEDINLKKDLSAASFFVKLNSNIEELKKKKEISENEINILKSKKLENEKLINELNKQINKYDEDKAVILSFDSMMSNSLSKLKKEKVLSDEDPQEKLIKINKEIKKLKERKNEEITRYNKFKKKIEKIDENLKKSESTIISYENKNSNLLNRINESDSLKKEICNHRFFVQLFGTDDFDPDSSDIMGNLNSAIERKKNHYNKTLIERENLKKKLEELSSLSTSLSDQNTIEALNYLKQNNIESAKLFTEYLHDHYKKDKDSLIDHINSNPGRFLGICTNGDDYKKVSGLVNDISLKRPVVVSIADTRKDDNPHITLFGVKDVFLDDSEIRRLKSLKNKEIKEINKNLEDTNEEIDSLYKLNARLSDYIQSYGSGKLKRYKDEYDMIHLKKVEQINKNSILKAERDKIESDIIEYNDKSVKDEKELDRLEYNKKLIESFISDFSSQSEENKISLKKIESKKEELNIEIDNLTGLNIEIDTVIESEKANIIEYSKEIDKFDSEKSDIEIDNLSLTDKVENEVIKEKTTEILRSEYNTHLKILKSKKSDNNYENINSLIESKTDQKKSYLKEMKRFINADQNMVSEISELEENKIIEIEENTREKLEKNYDLSGKTQYEIKDLKRSLKDLKPDSETLKLIAGFDKLDIESIETELEKHLKDKKRLFTELEVLKRETETSFKEIENLKKIRRETSLLSKNIRYDYELIQIEQNSYSLPDELDQREILVDSINEKYSISLNDLNKKRTICEDRYNKLLNFAGTDKFREFEPNLSAEIVKGNFESTTDHIENQLSKTEERIESVNAVIDESQKDLDLCVDKLMNHITMAISKLKRAVKISTLPESLDKFGGKNVLKMSTDLNSIPQSARRKELETYVKSLAEKDYLPSVASVNGDELTADAVCSVVKSKNTKGSVGIKIIKLSRNVSYTPVEKVTGSGGESMTAALLLYLVMAQLRAESKGGNKDSAGGFLLMDNPFAKATKPEFVKAQVELANLLGFQLIYATGIKDLNAIAQFAHIVQLRPSSVNVSNDKINVDKVTIESSELTTIN